MILIQSWKCLLPATQPPNRWPTAFSSGCGHCQGTWSNRWRNFSNQPHKIPRTNFRDAIRTHSNCSRDHLVAARNYSGYRRRICWITLSSRNTDGSYHHSTGFTRPVLQTHDHDREWDFVRLVWDRNDPQEGTVCGDCRMRAHSHSLVVRLGNSSDTLRLTL